MAAAKRPLLVDTSVIISWLDGQQTPEVAKFREAMQAQAEVYLSPLCIYESGVGILDASQRSHVMELLCALPVVAELSPAAAASAVNLHHLTKRAGHQNSGTVDLLLAGLALTLEFDLLTEDRWFKQHASRHGVTVL